ncbi:MAG: membrane protein involved in colicin uptake [Saprospiraceae bacterium]|jgi:membrane protein involved in colicin uptake
MEYIALHKEEENKQKGIIVSVVIHLLLLLLCLIPYMAIEDKPEQLSGILVSFGSPENGSSDAAPISDNDQPTQDSKPSESSSADDDSKSTAPAQEEAVSKPKEAAAPIQEITPISETSDIAAKEAKKEKSKRDKEAAEADKLKSQAEERAKLEAQKKADEAAKKAALDAKKGQFSDLLGSGKGNNNNTGNQGVPNGDPNSSALDQLATGSGRIGGGLSNRGVLFEPEINDSSQKTGKVVIKVCVDKTGKISEAKFTQRGSTTTDKYLVDIATKAAKKYQFTPSDIETQCGNITIEFKVQ